MSAIGKNLNFWDQFALSNIVLSLPEVGCAFTKSFSYDNAAFRPILVLHHITGPDYSFIP